MKLEWVVKLTVLLFLFTLCPAERCAAQTKQGTSGREKTNGNTEDPSRKIKDTVTDKVHATTDLKDTNDQARQSLRTSVTQPEEPEINISPNNMPDSAAQKAYSNALVAYYNALERKNLVAINAFNQLKIYDTWALQNRKGLIQRQQNISIMIFVLVVIVVSTGLIFSALQFRIAMKGMKRKGLSPDTSFKASFTGVEVSSSILGVIILTLSLVFFYLYLTNVFPIVTLS